MKKRLAFTVFLLFPLFLLAVGASFPLDPENIVLFGAFFTLLASAGTWFIWNARLSFDAFQRRDDDGELIGHQGETRVEKRKRDTLDNVLRDLSDEQLDVLQQRLDDNIIDDEVLHERIVGADGELIRRE